MNITQNRRGLTLEKKNVLIMISAFLSSLALKINIYAPSINQIKNALEEHPYLVKQFLAFNYFWKSTDVSSIVIFVFLYLFYRRYLFSKKDVFFSTIVACFYSFFFVFGFSYKTTNSCVIVYFFLVTIMLFLGYGLLFFAITQFVIELVNKSREIRSEHGIDNYSQTKTILKNFLIIITCWIPYLIFYLPGNLYPDGMDQLTKYFGYKTWTKHQPPFSTILMGVCVKFGELFGSDNFGLFVYVIFQFIVCAYAFSKSLLVLKQIGCPTILYRITLFFYCFYSVWPAYAICMIKDTLFVAISLLYFLKIIEITMIENINKKNIALLVILGVLTCLMRNNGIYMVVASLLVLFFKMPHKRLMITAATVFGMYLLINNILFGAMGITKGGTQEMLSIPFQQTARYVSEYYDEVTEDEKEAINGVLNFEIIATEYNPNCSDPVKGTYHWGYDEATTLPGEREALIKYFKVWLKMFFKHPGCYIDATYNNIYAYFYPEQSCHEGYYQITNDPVVDVGAFKFNYVFNYDNARSLIENISEIMRRIPALGLLYSSGTYDLVLLFIALYWLIKKKWSQFFLILPYLILLLTCLASPVNGCLRYILSIAAVMPIIIVLFYNTDKITKDTACKN